MDALRIPQTSICLAYFLSLLVPIQAKEQVCCVITATGCFRSCAPFDHLPLPECQSWHNVEFQLYTKDNIENFVLLQTTLLNPPPSEYDGNKPTVFILHGFHDDSDTCNIDWFFKIKDTLLEVHDCNVILVNWQVAAGCFRYGATYYEAASNTRIIGAMVERIIRELVIFTETDWTDIWCIGGHLGAHVCAHAGMKAGRTIGRVTGLDPSGPGFDEHALEVGLNSECAHFVDVIHTDPMGEAKRGLRRPAGYMDVYLNGLNNYQPGCVPSLWRTGNNENLDILCSHKRAYKVFIELLKNPKCFNATYKCDVVKDNMPSGCQPCKSGMCPLVGFDWRNVTKGIYYIATNSHSPYCVNMAPGHFLNTVVLCTGLLNVVCGYLNLT